jgi:hypothetical protein
VFVRFVVHSLDHHSGRRQGLFQAARRLKRSGILAKAELAHLEELGAWFNQNLEKPKRFALSSRPHAKEQAISWFRDTATEHVAKMRELQEVLERHGVTVEMIKTERPGYVLNEDEFQVAAYPFSETRT